MKPKTLGTIAIGLIWTGLAVWAGWSIYDSAAKNELWIAIAMDLLIAVAYVIVMLKLNAVPQAICAILWLHAVFGLSAPFIVLMHLTELPHWLGIACIGLLAAAWIFVITRWNTFASLGNAYYAILWYYGVLAAVLSVFVFAILPLSWTFGVEEYPPDLLQALILTIWLALIWFRVPWRYPWLLLLAIALLLWPFGFVVMVIGLTKLIIESLGRRNVLARSRFRAGPISTPTRGLVEYHA